MQPSSCFQSMDWGLNGYHEIWGKMLRHIALATWDSNRDSHTLKKETVILYTAWVLICSSCHTSKTAAIVFRSTGIQHGLCKPSWTLLSSPCLITFDMMIIMTWPTLLCNWTPVRLSPLASSDASVYICIVIQSLRALRRPDPFGSGRLIVFQMLQNQFPKPLLCHNYLELHFNFQNVLAFRLFSRNQFDAFRLAGRVCYTAHNEAQQVICHCQMDRAGGMREAIE